MPLCPFNTASEQYTDFLYRCGSTDVLSISQEFPSTCTDAAFSGYTVVYAPAASTLPISLEKYPYYSIPKLYTLLDSSALDSSGIFTVFNQPALGLRGRGTLIGFLDTGIDYRNPVFQNADGTTRILGIWDQTIPDPESGGLPPGVPAMGGFPPISYGTTYTMDQINEALASQDPLSIVPSTDTDGHGTFLAGVAAGSAVPEQDFLGAAPEAYIAAVKLKPAKEYLRDFFLVTPNVPAFQENDIILGIRYLFMLAKEYAMPLTICLGLGTNWGSHEGTSPLSNAFGAISQSIGVCGVIAAGNETGLSHHYTGSVSSSTTPDEVEIRVGGGENGFVLELWASTPEIYTVGFVSPSGEVISRIPLNLNQDSTVSFLLEPTTITVHYRPHELGSGKQLIFMRFLNPTQGDWRIRVYSSQLLSGDYHMWLPPEGFISPNTVFLTPDPFTTITSPGDTATSITTGAYNHIAGNIYIHSGRGYTLNNRVKPDLAAPGVEVFGPGLIPEAAYRSGIQPASIPMTRKTGTSVAAAITAGAVANLLSWGIVAGNDRGMSEAAVRAYLVRGASRSRTFTYPNPEWGYGSLNLYNTFLQLRE